MSAQPRTFRGRSLAELLPRIRQELGPDAVITRQREGLQGGFAGFFQKQFVEVEAHRGGRVVAVYDDGLESPAIRALIQQASPFAEHLESAVGGRQSAGLDTDVAPEPQRTADSGQPTTRRFGRVRPPQADAIEQTLIDAGLSARLA